MQMLRRLMVIGALAMANGAFPAAAQQTPPPAQTEDHSAQRGDMDQGTGQRAAGGGMMGGMMGRGGMMGGCPMMGEMMGGQRGMKMDQGMVMHSVPMMEARLAYFKADLEITEAQMPAWNAYADAVRARHAKMEQVRAGMMNAKDSGNALQRMDARIKFLETLVDSLKASKPAVEALYGALTDEQKRKADELFGASCSMM